MPWESTIPAGEGKKVPGEGNGGIEQDSADNWEKEKLSWYKRWHGSRHNGNSGVP